MKNLIALTLLPLTIASTALASVDFSGLWEGSCVTDGKTIPGIHLAIENTELKISMIYLTTVNEGPVTGSGMTYPLTKPMDYQTAADDTNGHWDYRTTYDWSWNVGRNEINMSSRTVTQGDRAKYEAVMSQTSGSIRLVNSQLEIYQNTIVNMKTPERKSEIWCRYAKH